MILDLGCGLVGEETAVKLDRYYYGWPVDVIADLERPLPFATAVFDRIRAWDILEHIRNLLPLMDELWRILRGGGVLDVQVPRFPHEDAVHDPTHVRYFTPVTFNYFTSGYGQRFQMPCKPWEILTMEATENRIFTTLRPHKTADFFTNGGFKTSHE